MRFLLCVALLAISVTAMAEKLTIERIYGDPDLGRKLGQLIDVGDQAARNAFRVIPGR